MKSIEIKFDDPTTGKVIHDYSFQMPESIEEMDPVTFVSWCSLINQGLPEAELKLRAFLLFSRIDIVRLAIKVPSANPYEIFTQTLYLIDPLISQKIITREFFTGSTFKKLFAFTGPGDHMANTTFAQYSLADHSFLLYQKHGNIKDLNELCAALYSNVEKFTYESFLANKAYFNNVSARIKLAMMHNYWGLRNWQKSIWPHAFSEEESTPKDSPNFTLTDWDAISINIAESGVFGYKAIVDSSPINEILKFINDRKLESLKRKSKP